MHIVSVEKISTVLFDIETTGLFPKNGDVLLSCVFLDLNGKKKKCKTCGKSHPEPYNIVNHYLPESDLEIASEIRLELSQYERIIGWNTHGFDLKFVNDRLRGWGEPLLLHSGSFDMKEYCKKTFPYMDGHQDSFGRAIGIKHNKTALDMAQNRRIGMGQEEPEDWKQLLHHNNEDVLGMWEIYDYLFLREQA